jgi:diketogulonate reductase-like aldo/keto reductase
LSTKHVRENLGALDVELDEDDLAALGALHQAA